MAQEKEGTVSASLSVLIIGGTGFVGSHQVHAAVARGHKVTVFSRGERKLNLPAEVEVLAGDRYKDLNLMPGHAGRRFLRCIGLAAAGPSAAAILRLLWRRHLRQVLPRQLYIQR